MTAARTYVFYILLLVLMTGCSSMSSSPQGQMAGQSADNEAYPINTYKRSIHLFQPVPLINRVESQQLEPKVTQLFVLVDETFPKDAYYRQYPLGAFTREIYRRFNRTIAGIDIRGWAFSLREKPQKTDLPIQTQYDSKGIERALNAEQTLTSIGTEDLAEAIDILGKMAQKNDGNVALLILTSWDRVDRSVVESAGRFRQRMQANAGFEVASEQQFSGSTENLEIDAWRGGENRMGCISMLGVGNRLASNTLYEIGACGISEAADKVGQPRDMSHFAERILYKGPTDTDGDGIYDYKDECPGTDPGRMVLFNGCPRFESTVSHGAE